MKKMLIIFSGLDGAGKSTQIDLLAARLQLSGLKPQFLWSRGGYTAGIQALKTLLRSLSKGRALPPPGQNPDREKIMGRSLVRRLWLVLAILDLIRVYGLQVRLWLAQGKTVISDRYIWDTLIDFRLNFPHEQVDSWLLWKFLVWCSPKPRHSFLFLIPVSESLRRSEIKNEPFRDSPQVLEQRLRWYGEFAIQGHWQVMDGLRSREELACQIRQVVGLANAD